tara:strand:+ start:429 stop:1559 length:1131 start_codon:yes stop_codon:yes gene_type:complete
MAKLFTGDFVISFHLADLIDFISTRTTLFKIAIYSSAVLFGLVLLSVVSLAFIRMLFHIKRHRIQNIERIWAPILAGTSSQRPELRKHQSAHVLSMWVALRSKAAGKTSVWLDEIAHEIGLDKVVFAILTPRGYSITSRPVWLRILAITAAQWLYSDRVINSLWGALASNNRSIALRACTSLVSLKAENYEKAVIKLLFRFPEQAPGISAQIGAAGGGQILHILEPFLDRLPNYTITNIITLAERSTDKSLLPLIIEKLHQYRNIEEAGSLLRAIGNLGGHEERAEVIPFLSHDVAFLRIQAAKTLGRIGDLSDIPLITPLLSDENWWFRYRAAEAIINLSGKNQAFVEEMINSEDDPKAAEILKHVLSEQTWSVT